MFVTDYFNYGINSGEIVVFVAFCSQIGYFFVYNNAGQRFNITLFCGGSCHSELRRRFTRKYVRQS